LDRLAEIAAELGRPELVNAPVIRTGLSAVGGFTVLFAQEHADRVLAAVATQPLAPFAKGNEGFNFNRPNSKGGLEAKTYDVSQTWQVSAYGFVQAAAMRVPARAVGSTRTRCSNHGVKPVITWT
jgi:hypothetical protein